MEIRIVPDYAALSQEAAKLIALEIRQNPGLVLGLAAGNTPLGAYHELVRLHREEHLDFSRTVFFNLDEYSDVEQSHRQKFHDFLQLNLVQQINIRRTNVHFLSYPTGDAERYCDAFEREIRQSGGIDLQILGIGINGHIAFNEPGSAIDSRTRIVTLEAGGAPASPKTAVTMGVATILESHRILLLASGPQKAGVLAKALEGPVTPKTPASALQQHHDVVVIADKESAADLQRLKRAG